MFPEREIVDSEIVERPDGMIYRYVIVADEDAVSPRDGDNPSMITIVHNRLIDPDPSSLVEMVVDEVNEGRMSTAGAARYLRVFGNVRVALPINVSAGPWNEYTTSDVDLGRGVRIDGFVWSHEDYRDTMGDCTDAELTAALKGDVDAYSRWASGEYVGVVVQVLDDQDADLGSVQADPNLYDWEEVDSVWSIDDVEYARQEGLSMIEHADVPMSAALAAQV